MVEARKGERFLDGILELAWTEEEYKDHQATLVAANLASAAELLSDSPSHSRGFKEAANKEGARALFSPNPAPLGILVPGNRKESFQWNSEAHSASTPKARLASTPKTFPTRKPAASTPKTFPTRKPALSSDDYQLDELTATLKEYIAFQTVSGTSVPDRPTRALMQVVRRPRWRMRERARVEMRSV
jgi:hypothetical protein